MIKPTKKVPQLNLKLINGTQWELQEQTPKEFTMLVFYRGLHCPICKNYLEELKTKLNEFSEKGVNVIAVSMDSEKRAKETAEKWDIKDIPLGYELSEDKAREWGLFISNSIKKEEPKVFSEPAVFLIKPDGSLYCSSIQSMPFSRPSFNDLLKSIDFIKKNDYPARGGK